MRFIAIFLLAVVVLLSSSCSSTETKHIFSPVGDSVDSDVPSVLDVENFIKCLNNGEYNEAIEIYNSRIFDDYTLRTTAAYEFEALFRNVIQKIYDGKLTVSEAELKTKMLSRVASETGIETDKYKTLLADINGAIASRKAFDVAVQLEELQNYEDAAKEYAKVSEIDSNYTKAVEGLSRCFSNIKGKYFDAAKKYAKELNYLKAIEELEYLKEMFPYDDEVIAAVSTYEKGYIEYIISNSEKVFKVPAADYEAAIGEINKGLQHFSNNTNLIEKKAYYETFAPVSVYDMEEIKGDPNKKNTDKDRYGNVYAKCFTSNGSGMDYSYKSDATYFLDSKYNTFSATVYGKSKSNLAGEMTIQIYADEKIVYQKLEWPDNSSSNLNIKLDITGVREVRIVLKGEHSFAGIGMTDMFVQKTVG